MNTIKHSRTDISLKKVEEMYFFRSRLASLKFSIKVGLVFTKSARCLGGGMVDTRDLKSRAGNGVRVQVPP